MIALILVNCANAARATAIPRRPAEIAPQQLDESAGFLAGNLCQRREFLPGGIGSRESREDRTGVGLATDQRQPARALGNGEKKAEEDDCGERFGTEHPAPAPLRVPVGITPALNHEVDEEDQQDAGDDPELEQGSQAPAVAGVGRSRQCTAGKSSTRHR